MRWRMRSGDAPSRKISATDWEAGESCLEPNHSIRWAGSRDFLVLYENFTEAAGPQYRSGGTEARSNDEVRQKAAANQSFSRSGRSFQPQSGQPLTIQTHRIGIKPAYQGLSMNQLYDQIESEDVRKR